MNKVVVGFYEGEYPIYSDEWTHELQSPVTAYECNSMVNQIKLLSDLLRKAGDMIHSEYCSIECHSVCISIEEILRKK